MNEWIQDLQDVVAHLEDARENLQQVRNEFQDNPGLLAFYEPSARELVREYEDQLCALVNDFTHVPVNIDRTDIEDIDVWVRIQGTQFESGEGPINQVAGILQNLNTANQHALALLEHEKYSGGRFNTRIASGAMFKLAATKAGSLQLGLKRPDFEFVADDQSVLPLLPSDPWDDFKVTVAANQKPLEAFRLLMRALAAVEDEQLLHELIEELNTNDLVKLFHYARELTPSERSPIESISFEGSDIGIPSNRIATNKETRMLISIVSTKLTKNRRYVSGTAVVRGQDLDKRTLIARPFISTERNKYSDLTCVFSKKYPISEIGLFLDQPVTIEGFLVFNAHGIANRLEIDEISLIEGDD